MMAELINLRRARKAKSRAEKDRTADANRLKHGTAKPERDLAKGRAEKERRTTDQHKLDDKQ
jgi:hypothetical protein